MESSHRDERGSSILHQQYTAEHISGKASSNRHDFGELIDGPCATAPQQRLVADTKSNVWNRVIVMRGALRSVCCRKRPQKDV